MKGLFPGNIDELLQHAQKIQKDISELHEEAKKREVEASAGGGMVTVKVNGEQLVTALRIDESVVKENDLEMLQDLVRAAVNEGVRKSKEMIKDEMKKVTGGLPIPGLS